MSPQSKLRHSQQSRQRTGCGTRFFVAKISNRLGAGFSTPAGLSKVRECPDLAGARVVSIRSASANHSVARVAKVLPIVHALRIGNPRYSRMQSCATTEAFGACAPAHRLHPGSAPGSAASLACGKGLARRRHNQLFWTAAGSEAPRRFGTTAPGGKAVSPLRSATAVQNLPACTHSTAGLEPGSICPV